MKWLELNENERRDKSLTIRISQTTQIRFAEIINHLSKKYGSVSQGDLFEQWVQSAHKELSMERNQRKDAVKNVN